MEELMTYKSLYDEAILRVFGNYRDDIESLRLDSEYVVNIRKIVSLCAIRIIVKEKEIDNNCAMYHYNIPEFLSKPEADVVERIIRVSEFDNEARQRFNIARNLFLILNPNFEAEILQKYKTFNEVEVYNLTLLTANNFAADLLMPKKLVIRSLKKVMEDLNFNTQDNFSDKDIDLISDKAARTMNVPLESFKYRLKVLEIFM